MKSVVRLFYFSAFAVLALSHPLPRDVAPSDVDALNFALTLEHLENAFYAQGLSKFSQRDFVDAGFPRWSYGRLKQIAAHEAAHVQFLEATLGDKATKPCTYEFPYDDPKSFISLGHTLEIVGDSAYIDLLKLFENKDYLLAATTMLSNEARHSAWLDSAVRKRSPWSGPFDTPLDMNQAFTILTRFITSCPSTNPKLPATAFAEITLPDRASVRPGSVTPLKFTTPNNLDPSTTLYGAFLSGQVALIVPLTDGGKSVIIPESLCDDKLCNDDVYLAVTTDADGVDDSKTIAGPALLEFSSNSNGVLQTLPF